MSRYSFVDGWVHYWVCLWFFLITPFTWADQSQSLTLLYSGSLQGEIEPCGCSMEGDFGGIRRHVSVIDELKKDDPNLLHIMAGGFLDPHDARGVKNQYVIQGIGLVQPDAVGLLESDLSAPGLGSSEHPLPLVSHLALESPLSAPISKHVKPGRWIQRADLNVFVTSLFPTEAEKGKGNGGNNTTKGDNKGIKALNEQLKKAKREDQALVVVMVPKVDDAWLVEHVETEWVDVWIRVTSLETVSDPQWKTLKPNGNKSLHLYPGQRGMRLGLAQLKVEKQSVVDLINHRSVALSQDVKDSEKSQAWYDAYNNAIREDYQKVVALKAKRREKALAYVGESHCQACHMEIHQRWQASAHASAMETLEDVEKTHDPDCLSCHAVGFNEDEGFLDVSSTPELANVQCESCHGPAKQHLENLLIKPSPSASEEQCLSCHTKEHSPAFDFKAYWKKLNH